MCGSLPAERVVGMLHDLFSAFDDVLQPLGVFKVDTIGTYRPVPTLQGALLDPPEPRESSLQALGLCALQLSSILKLNVGFQ